MYVCTYVYTVDTNTQHAYIHTYIRMSTYILIIYICTVCTVYYIHNMFLCTYVYAYTRMNVLLCVHMCVVYFTLFCYLQFLIEHLISIVPLRNAV